MELMEIEKELNLEDFRLLSAEKLKSFFCDQEKASHCFFYKQFSS